MTVESIRLCLLGGLPQPYALQARKSTETESRPWRQKGQGNQSLPLLEKQTRTY